MKEIKEKSKEKRKGEEDGRMGEVNIMFKFNKEKQLVTSTKYAMKKK